MDGHQNKTCLSKAKSYLCMNRLVPKNFVVDFFAETY